MMARHIRAGRPPPDAPAICALEAPLLSSEDAAALTIRFAGWPSAAR
jgi:Flp pilus assembly protein TadB